MPYKTPHISDRLEINPKDLADNSDQPKVLKLQDIDTWSRQELINYIMYTVCCKG